MNRGGQLNLIVEKIILYDGCFCSQFNSMNLQNCFMKVQGFIGYHPIPLVNRNQYVFYLFIFIVNLQTCYSQDEIKQLAKGERMAIHASNIANVVLFAAKVYASFESRSLAVIASTMDSLLDLLSGFILWFTAHAMRKPNQFHYPIGKKRMQPVVSSLILIIGSMLLSIFWLNLSFRFCLCTISWVVLAALRKCFLSEQFCEFEPPG